MGAVVEREAADASHEIKDAHELRLIYHPVPNAVGSPTNDSPAVAELIHPA